MLSEREEKKGGGTTSCVYYFIFPRGSALLRGVYIVADAFRTRPLEFCDDKINMRVKERRGTRRETKIDRWIDQWNFSSSFELSSRGGARTVTFFVFSSSFDSWQKRGWNLYRGRTKNKLGSPLKGGQALSKRIVLRRTDNPRGHPTNKNPPAEITSLPYNKKREKKEMRKNSRTPVHRFEHRRR